MSEKFIKMRSGRTEIDIAEVSRKKLVRPTGIRGAVPGMLRGKAFYRHVHFNQKGD